MDDSLELPVYTPANLIRDEDEESSGDEDGSLDWTKLIPGAARPVIPKRGEKEFEPREDGGTSLQMHILDRARSAMFETLRATRTISSKGISYGIWHPSIGRTHVTAARGIHFSTMGHSAPRQSLDESGRTKVHKRLELLPEEAIYLIERGALFCWKECDLDTANLQGFEGIAGVPMSVQQAYAEMIGTENLTQEKFQVYAYLRRLGYAVTRAEPPNDSYPSPPPFDLSSPTLPHSIFRRIFIALFSIPRTIFRFLFLGFSWWRPLRISRWTHRNYGSVYRSLRFIPSGHNSVLHKSDVTQPPTAPYKIFYNVYKPSTPFKKTSPTHPDFQVVVINARTTPMPTFCELAALFDPLPTLPPPVPRPRRQAYGGKSTITPVSAAPIPQQTTATPQCNFLQRTFPSLFPPPLPPSSTQEPRRGPNPFAALKQGKKMVVIAAVDNGNISFFRFSQGAFEEWPMA